MRRLCYPQRQACDHPGFVVVRGWGGDRLRRVCTRCGGNEPRGNWLRHADHPGWRSYPLLLEEEQPCRCALCEARRHEAEVSRRAREADDARRQRWLEQGLSRSVRPDWTFERYSAYLLSPEWRRRRDQALALAEHRCQLCNAGEEDSWLQAHHRTYERLGREAPGDLTVLCKECHDYFHRVFVVRWD